MKKQGDKQYKMIQNYDVCFHGHKDLLIISGCLSAIDLLQSFVMFVFLAIRTRTCVLEFGGTTHDVVSLESSSTFWRSNFFFLLGGGSRRSN